MRIGEKMKKKIIIILTLMLFVSLFSGCTLLDTAPMSMVLYPDGTVFSQYSNNGPYDWGRQDWVKYRDFNWQYIDDNLNHDGDATVIHGNEYNNPNGRWCKEICSIEDPDEDSGDIHKLTLNVVARRWRYESLDCQIQLFIKSGNTYMPDIVKDLTDSYKTFSKEWSRNPFTGHDWTWNDIKNLEAGFYIGIADSGFKVTQLYIVVDYSLTSNNDPPEDDPPEDDPPEEDPEEESEWRWWFDDDTIADDGKCEYCEFYGAYAYLGLRTFATKVECEHALTEAKENFEPTPDNGDNIVNPSAGFEAITLLFALLVAIILLKKRRK